MFTRVFSIIVTIEDADSNEVFEALKAIGSVELVDRKGDNNRFEIQSRANETSRRAIFSLCVEKGWPLTEMALVETKLEDIFHELTMN